MPSSRLSPVGKKVVTPEKNPKNSMAAAARPRDKEITTWSALPASDADEELQGTPALSLKMTDKAEHNLTLDYLSQITILPYYRKRRLTHCNDIYLQ